MPEKTGDRRFEIVSGCKKIEERSKVSGNAVQGCLFPAQTKRCMIFVPLPGVSDAAFLDLVGATKPSHVIDLRPVPRFDIGALDRRTVFDTFRREQCTYLDLGDCDWRELQGTAPLPVTNILSNCGPVVCLVSEAQDFGSVQNSILQVISGGKGDWELYCIPATTRPVENTLKVVAKR